MRSRGAVLTRLVIVADAQVADEASLLACVCPNSARLCDLRVLVDHATEPIAPGDLDITGSGQRQRSQRRSLTQ
jgi:hypothetical protein